MNKPKIMPARKLSLKTLIVDHGMLLVLLLLCAAISALTVTDIHPEDPAAGRQLAKLALQKYGTDRNILIVVRDTDADRAFAQAINDELVTDEKLIVKNYLFNKNYLKLSIGKKRHIKVELN